MKIEDRFIAYTQFDTQSCEDSQTVPSTSKQLLFAEYLKAEMIAEGLTDVVLDDMGYLYATIPATVDDYDGPVIGFIAHYDTSPDCSGADIKARIIRDYAGGEVTLSPGRTMTPYPIGTKDTCDIIVTDGTTLLGADDKAGIAEIMHAASWLIAHPEIPHGKVRIAFNPDEEIGCGAHHFNVELFGCDFAYTVDGGELGELEYENFNAAVSRITFTGMSIHPGYAKGAMINAARIATEFAGMMPKSETPETTEGYEGFYHLVGMEGGCEKASLTYIIRDHDRQRFEERKAFIASVAARINEIYGEGVCVADTKDQYYNMKEKVSEDIVNRARTAMERAGVTPKVQPIRGGTDGAQLSFMGLPCPNIFTGAVNFHGPHEYVSIQVMEKAAETVANIVHSS